VKLVETDADRPEDETEPAPAVTPPVPEKRRAYVSLIFTAMIMVGTVVGIYTVIPAPAHEATTQAIREHRAADATWQLAAPSRAELEAWTLARIGEGGLLPGDAPDLTVVGARPVEVRHRDAAFIGFRIGGEAVSLLVSDAADPRSSERNGDDQIEAWRCGAHSCVAVGPAASAEAWKSRLGIP